MARPDPALLEAARYPYSCSIETRYRDLDSNLHVNNGAMASLLEEARVRFHRAAGFNNPSADPEGTVMVASVSIEYLGQSHYPEPLDCHVGFLRIGTSSYDLAQLITQDGGVVVFCRSTLVSVSEGRSHPISDSRRALVEAWMVKS